MKIIVIGGLGFVGSAICHHLQERGDVEIIIFDNGSRGCLENIRGVDCQYVCGDVTDPQALNETLASTKPDVVMHLAAIHFIPECNRNPVGCLTTNVVGTENVLQACRNTPSVRRVIITSSQAVYPISDGPNQEDDCPFPYDVYGESKYANEFQAMRFQRDTGIDTVIVRLSNVYGPRETNPHVLPEIMEQLIQDGQKVSLGNIEPKRDFIFTSDAARGYAALALNPIPAGSHVINLGSGQEYSVRDVLDKLSEILGEEIVYQKDTSRYRSTERMHLLADIQRIHDLVGWSPQVSIEAGLQELCQWYGLY